ncbi:phosphoenolpyruvate carboxylase 2 [Striga asiatica]|uniref:Phosphoenolpyruvate carboxylase 2 n=1 Tax=Striga asiatica TaxID=4170 RepID=A0A5A7Q4N1_STRAF|nr:phosphoenolpyruvate carboxylase 2 [Striga asiatica]
MASSSMEAVSILVPPGTSLWRIRIRSLILSRRWRAATLCGSVEILTFLLLGGFTASGSMWIGCIAAIRNIISRIAAIELRRSPASPENEYREGDEIWRFSMAMLLLLVVGILFPNSMIGVSSNSGSFSICISIISICSSFTDFIKSMKDPDAYEVT